MELRCDACRTLLGPADLVLGLGLGRCPNCRAVIDLDRERVPGPVVPHERQPARMALAQDRDLLEITWRWRGPQAWLMLIFCIFWDAFLVTWYANLLQHSGPLIAWLFPLLHVGAGVGISYVTLAMLFNKTRLSVGPTTLQVRHGPLPLRRSVELPVDGLKQLYVLRKEQHGRNGATSATYALLALHGRGNDSTPLLEGLDSQSEAKFLEQKLEAFLRITPAAVKGELG